MTFYGYADKNMRRRRETIMAQKTTTSTPATFTFDKEMFKRSVLYNVKTLYRKAILQTPIQGNR